MPQAVWTGTINFGLVSIPVKLYPATEPKDVRFHLYDRRSGRRVHWLSHGYPFQALGDRR